MENSLEFTKCNGITNEKKEFDSSQNNSFKLLDITKNMYNELPINDSIKKRKFDELHEVSEEHAFKIIHCNSENKKEIGFEQPEIDRVFRKLQTPADPHPGYTLLGSAENIKIIIHDRKRDENGNVIKENKIIDKYNKWYQNQETENYINYLNDKSNISNRNIIRYPLDSLLTNILRINNGNIRHNLSHNLNIPTSEQSLNTSSENISESVINEESMIPENLLESEEKNDQIIPLDIDPCIESEENNETMNSSQILSESDELSENIIENTLFEIFICVKKIICLYCLYCLYFLNFVND